MSAASGFVINGHRVLVPGLRVVNWFDDPALRLRIPGDGRLRAPTTAVQLIGIHTTKGIPGGKDQRPQVLRPGFGPATQAGQRVNKFWAASALNSGAHVVTDFDGTWYQLADLATEVTYHAELANERSIGIEVYQGSDAELYAGQLEMLVIGVDAITRLMGDPALVSNPTNGSRPRPALPIQRQFCGPYRGRPVARLETGGRDCYGLFGHRSQTSNRGFGDPGDFVFQAFARAGYLEQAWETGADRAFWTPVQAALGVPSDGYPGASTAAALRAKGRPSSSLPWPACPHGLLVARPGD